MIISQINFFIQCAKALRETHQAGSPTQKRQVETFLKTWLFYNSSSADIFWTGKTSQQVNGEAWTKEHWYGNLSSAYYIMNQDVLNIDFFDLTKPNQVLKVFKFMQWNKTSQAENIRLRKFQRPEIFFETYGGDPERMYHEAGVVLQTIGNNLLPELTSFFNYPNLEPNNVNSSIFEIGMASKKRLVSFLSHLTEASESIGVNLNCVRISNKGCLYRIHPTIELPDQNSFANFYLITMTALWKLFQNQEEIQAFLVRYNYEIAQNNINEATFIGLAINEGDQAQYLLMMKLFEFFSATLNVYDYNLELRNRG